MDVRTVSCLAPLERLLKLSPQIVGWSGGHMKFMKCLLFSGLFAGFLIACGGESTPEAEAPEVPPAEAPAPAPEPPPEPVASATATATPEPPPPPAPEPLTDEQIAQVTDAANNAEVEQAKLAQKKGKHPRV